MLKAVNRIILSLILVVSSFFVVNVQAEEYMSANVGYQVKIQDNWLDYSFGGALAGNEGGETVQALSVHLINAPYEATVEFRVHTSQGWKDWVKDFELAESDGTVNGVQIRLLNYPNAEIHYQTYRKGLGWGSWAKNGATSGTLNSSNPITGIRVKVFEVGVKYQSSINNDWLLVRHNGEDQGFGKLESIRIGFENPIPNAKIVYRAYFETSGWTSWVSTWETLGTIGSNRGLQALEVKLENLPGYAIAVQPYIKNSGWWEWVNEGETVGNMGDLIDAYRIKIIKVKYIPAPPTTDDPVIGDDPNTSNLSLDAAEYNHWDGLKFEGKTIDGIFEEDFGFINQFASWSNHQIQIGWKVKGLRAVAFDGVGDTIQAPKTFTNWGDDAVNSQQFEVYLGTLINGVFTVTGNGVNNFDQTGATHTMILYDNEDPEETDGYSGDPGYLEGIVMAGVYTESIWYVDTSDSEYNYLYIAEYN